MQNPELFACLSKERKENLLENLLFRPSIYERLYYEEEMVRKQIVCYEEFLQIVRNPQIRAAAPEIDFEFEEFSANSYLSLVDEYLYRNKVPGDILLRLKKAAEDALAYAEETKISARRKKPCLEHHTQSRAISTKFRFPSCWTPTSMAAKPWKASTPPSTKPASFSSTAACSTTPENSISWIRSTCLRVTFSMRNLT